MNLGEADLQSPAPLIARRMARQFADNVRSERKRLDDQEDLEALHDFRVAMRKLRTWLRAYRPALSDTVSRRLERRLRRIASATDEIRNVEVRLALIEGIQRRARASAAAPEWLERRLKRRMRRASQEFQRVLNSDFDKTARRLDKALSRYMASVDTQPESFGLVTVAVLAQHAEALSEALGQITAIDQRDQMHLARIAAKRLRYALAPLVSVSPIVSALATNLASIQEALGNHRDANLFLADVLNDERLVALSRLLKRRERAAFALVTAWIGASGRAELAAKSASVGEAIRDSTTRLRKPGTPPTPTAMPPLAEH